MACTYFSGNDALTMTLDNNDFNLTRSWQVIYNFMFCIPGKSHTLGDIVISNNRFFHGERPNRIITGFFEMSGPINVTFQNNVFNAYVEGSFGALVRLFSWKFLCHPIDEVPVYFTFERNTVSYSSPDQIVAGSLAAIIDQRFLGRDIHILYDGNTWENLHCKYSGVKISLASKSLIILLYHSAKASSRSIIRNTTFRNVAVSEDDMLMAKMSGLGAIEIDGIVYDNCTSLIELRTASLMKLHNVIIKNTLVVNSLTMHINADNVEM